jgi:hypothetical protein
MKAGLFCFTNEENESCSASVIETGKADQILEACHYI